MNEMITSPAWAIWINNTALSDWVVGAWYIWPTLETLHFIGLCVLLGGLIVVDFRLMGFIKNLSIKMTQICVRLALFGFVINLLTGICFLAGNTWKYAEGNLAFDIKLILIVILGMNAILFKIKIESMLESGDVTNLSRFVGAVSLLLWCLVIVCGRMITFFATHA